MAPALFGGVAAAPGDPSGTLAPASPEPVDPPAEAEEPLPPDPADLETMRTLAQAEAIADLAPEQYRMLIVEAANRHGVDPRLVASVITVESEWVAGAVGGVGEQGLMQILPSTGLWLARVAGLEQVDLFDPYTNVELGTMYLAMLLQDYGSVEKALAAYNGGPRAVQHWRTNLYARKVLKVYNSRPKAPAVPVHRPLAIRQTAS